MNDLDYRLDRIALDARSVSVNVEFIASLTQCRGRLTPAHVALESARLSLARAKEIVDQVADQAERYRQESAERDNPTRSAA